MSEVILVAESGRATGSPSSRRLRGEDRIPAVVYGHGQASTAITINRRDLRLALSTAAGMNAVINLSIDGKTKPAVVKDMQRHPVRRTVQHVDFLVVDLNAEITVDVPVVMIGEAKEVTSAAGLVDLQIATVAVSTTPRNIPQELQIDITGMTIGDTKRASDIKLPKNVTLASDPDMVVVSTEATRGTLDIQAGEAAS